MRTINFYYIKILKKLFYNNFDLILKIIPFNRVYLYMKFLKSNAMKHPCKFLDTQENDYLGCSYLTFKKQLNIYR